MSSISLNWSNIPNDEQKLKFNLNSTTLNNQNQQQIQQNNPFQTNQFEFLPSPRSSISSSFSNSLTPPPQLQSQLTLLNNNNSNLINQEEIQISQNNSSSNSTNSSNFEVDHSNHFNSSFLNDYNQQSSTTTTATNYSNSPTSQAKIELTAAGIPTTSTATKENTQLALAEIFAGTQRPQYRSNSFTNNSNQPTSPFSNNNLPLPYLTSPYSITSPTLSSTTTTSTTTNNSLTPRSYFSPPIPTSRIRSQSSAPDLDRNMSNTSTTTTSSLLSPTSPPFSIPVSATISPNSNNNSFEYRTPISTTALPNHYSSSVPTSVNHFLSSSVPKNIGFEDYNNLSNGGKFSSATSNRPTISQFGSFNGISGGLSPSFSNSGFELQQQNALNQQQQHQQQNQIQPGITNWRSRSQSASSPSAPNFGWDENGLSIEREGRSQLRSDDLTSTATTTTSSWNGRDLSIGSIGSNGSNNRTGTSLGGIGLANLSPFSRDGRTLLDFPPPNSQTSDSISSPYKPRREYSLGPVGSGRKRSDTIWGLERPLRESEEDGDDNLDSFAPTRSGATSRRHSVAGFNLPRISSLGFDLPVPTSIINGETKSTSSIGSGGFTMITPTSSNSNNHSSSGNNNFSRGGLGSSAIDDDDLASDLDLNSLHLSLDDDQQLQQQEQQRRINISQLGSSMPTNFTLARRVEDSLSTSNNTGGTGSHISISPPKFSPPSAASRFFQPQTQAQQSQQSQLSTAQNGISTNAGINSGTRFEFGSVGTSPSFNQNLELGYAPLPLNSNSSSNINNNILQQPQPQHYGMFNLQSQQIPQSQSSSIPLQPPTSSFYPPLLSAQTPSFHSYQSQQQQLPPLQLQTSLPQPYYSPNTLHNLSLGPLPPLSVPNPELTNLGRGVPLHSIPPNVPLYIVEFKAGRKDLFFVEDQQSNLHSTLTSGDLVIVEADRGKDIGKFFKICSLEEVQLFQQRLVENALGALTNPNNINNNGMGMGGMGNLNGGAPNSAAIARMTKEFQPKKIFGKALPMDTQMLLSKAQDEVKALTLIRSRVAQKNLAMEICDAEWQWDRRKLTFYYIADARIDFRELVRELFRLYKTRIWMCCLDQSSAWDFK